MKVGKFFGRDREFTLLLEGPAPAVFVHGQGGLGKTALLAEVARAWPRDAGPVSWVDGRDSANAQQACATAIAELRAAGAGLLILDTYEEAPALGAVLRDELPALLGEGVRVIIAGRRPPEQAWDRVEWQGWMIELPLSSLDEDESLELVAARGIDARTAAALVGWGQGHPLSLSVAADAVLAGSEIDLDDLDADALLGSILARRIGGTELQGADREVLAVAAIARAVDSRLISAVLPDVDSEQAIVWLHGLSFSELLGTRVTLHARMRSAIRAELKASDPFLDREIRRKMADHLYARAILGELTLIVDIAELIDDPAVRWGIAPPPATHTADRPQPGDAAEVAAAIGAEEEAWWPGARRWFEEAPECAMVIRDAEGRVDGWAIITTPAGVPSWGHEDPVLGPWIAHALEVQPDGDVLMMRDGGDVAGGDLEVASPAISAGNYRAVLLSGLPTVRRIYSPSAPDDARAQGFLEAMGYERVPELDAYDNGRTVQCWAVDNGPGGIPRMFRDLVYRDLEMTPPPPVGGAGGESVEDAIEVVREALRSFHDPIALSSSPLARGATAEERAESVRSLLNRATVSAFGDSRDEQLQRTTIELAYLDPEGGHGRALKELHVSRTTYYRRLSAASVRVGSYVAMITGVML